MKILVIKGSPHTKGSTALLADEFIKGARENGHAVTVFDAAASGIKPCTGCNFCKMDGTCAINDSMENLKDMIRTSDMLVFVTPLYYFGFSAQLKTIIDRFHSFHYELMKAHKKAALIAAAFNNEPDVFDSLKTHYLKITSYMNFENKGILAATSCGTPELTAKSGFMRRAYDFGKSI